LIAAIGRGIGRGAAHEFAHLIGYAAHSSRDRGSYEYHAASRPEQYFGPMHWETARPVLEKRLGRRVMEAGIEAQRDEQLIRDTRARSNEAIAAHDIAGIARAWANDIHVVSSTSAQTAGSQANQQRFAQQFKSRPDTVYVRTPATVDVYPPWNVASERGTWVGRWTEPDGQLEIGGTYQAQWRKVDGQWLTQAELYVPTHCRGSKYCNQRP
jgi:ketosteroid isomerase-like protein